MISSGTSTLPSPNVIRFHSVYHHKGHLDALLGHLDASLGHLDASLGHLDASLSHLDASLDIWYWSWRNVDEHYWGNKILTSLCQFYRLAWIYYILSHCGRGKMADNYLTTISNAFSWMKMYKLRLRFHWNLFTMVQLTIFRHWFR